MVTSSPLFSRNSDRSTSSLFVDSGLFVCAFGDDGVEIVDDKVSSQRIVGNKL